MNLYLVNLLCLKDENIKTVIKRYPDIGYLMSYFSKQDLQKIVNYGFKNIMIDSGAYTAFTQGKEIDIDELCDFYIETAKNYPDVNFVFVALDIIDDYSNGWDSVSNYKYMIDRGVECIPTFHYGDDWSVLEYYCSVCDYIAIGGLVSKRRTNKQLQEYLTKIFVMYPDKHFHLFGINNLFITRKFNAFSCDSLTWRSGSRFGRIIMPDRTLKVGRNYMTKEEADMLGVTKLLAKYNIPYPFPEDFSFDQLDLVNIDVLYEEIVKGNVTPIDSMPILLF